MLPGAHLISLLSLSALSLSTGRQRANKLCDQRWSIGALKAQKHGIRTAEVYAKSEACAEANRLHLINLIGPDKAASIASISNFVGNGFVRYATQPVSIAALRVASLSLAVMNTTGSSIPERIN
jgi:hypothetical protein